MNCRTLRVLFAYLQEFQALFEAHGIDTIVGPDGDRYNYFDLQNLFEKRFSLPRHQAAAIQECCYADLDGAHSATALGADANQVEQDADEGLRALCEMYNGCPYEEDEEEKTALIVARINEGTFLGEDHHETFVWSVPAAGG
jgi:hypothetical protein